MKLGLGSGTTARHFVDLVGEQVKGGLQVVCVGDLQGDRRRRRRLSAFRFPRWTISWNSI